jgi:hypothetical protein
VLLPAGDEVTGGTPAPAPGPLGRFIWEPDPAVTRADALGAVAEQLHAHAVANRIAYLTGDHDVTTPFATRFEIEEILPFDTKAMRFFVRTHQIGALEIKTRGLDLDPAAWRKTLGLKGKHQATVIATPTVNGAVVAVVTRR